jgi:hypothetical protein
MLPWQRPSIGWNLNPNQWNNIRPTPGRRRGEFCRAAVSFNLTGGQFSFVACDRARRE